LTKGGELKRKSFTKTFVRSVNPFGARTLSTGLFITLAVLILLLSTFRPQLFGDLRSRTTDMVYPVIDIVAKPVQGVAAFVRDVSGLAELQAQNARLEQENARLREWYQMALLLQAENKSLRELLNYKLPPKYSYITSTVVSDSGNAFVKSLLVEAGGRDGVEKGQAVLSGNGLIGRVVQTGQKTSRILLVTDMNSRVPVIVENTQQHGILAGQNDQDPTITRVSNDAEISIGARIVTSGRGGVFPYGIPVGRVFLDDKGEKRVSLSSDMNAIHHVRIVKKPVDENLRLGVVE